METAKTFRSRDDTKNHAEILLKKLEESPGTKPNTYNLNKLDFSIACKEEMHKVSRDLYRLGYKAVNFLKEGWRIDPMIKKATFYVSRSKAYPVLVRESTEGWGSLVVQLGEELPIFEHALEELNEVLDGKRMLTVMHPVEGTSGLALICGLKTQVHARGEIDADDRLHDHPVLNAKDVLLSKGFQKKKADLFVSIKLGVIVKLNMNNHELIIVDTPWA